MKKLYTDFWYGDKLSECTRADCFFSDCDCIYRGNFYIGDRAVGDYACSDSNTILEAWEKSHTANRTEEK